MRRLFGLALAAVILTQPLSRAAANETGSAMPKVGDMAPDFSLKYVDSSGMHDISLSQYRGKKQVVLAFYVFAFTGG
jgi:peroxiredoxin